MNFRIREILFGNWRNKGVALFFAVIIWVIAYQAETQSDVIPVRLTLTARSESQTIIRQECIDAQGKLVPFDGTVLLSVTGPRKQVERFRDDESLRTFRFPVDSGPEPSADPKPLALSGASFPSISKGVMIASVSPDQLFLSFDITEEREFPVVPIYQRIPPGMEAESPKIEPSAVKLWGPRSLLDRMRLVVEPWLGASEQFDDTLPILKRYPDTFDKSLVERTVRFVGPSQVRLIVRLRYKSDSFDAEGIRVRFLVPAVKFPVRIQFDDETIKVRFQGPVQEIQRLREKVKDPDFDLAVLVPPLLAEGEKTFTFTETGLLLYGFSERIQILQHPHRQAQGKGAWSYSIVPTGPPSQAGKE